MTRKVYVIGLGDLTPQQRRVVQLDMHTNHLVLGPAGSGKTLVLLYRARHLLGQAQVPADCLRVFVYTNALVAYIQSGFAAVDLPTDVVESFFGWLGHLAKRLGVKVAAKGEERWAHLPTAVLAEVKRRRMPPWLDAVLVDEGQDLPADAFGLLTRVAKHVTVMADYAQTIYDHGARISEVAAALGLSRESAVLLQDLRNAPDVAEVAASFLEPEMAASYLRSQALIIGPESRRIPVLFRGNEPDNEWEYLAGLVRREVQAGKRVGILVPTNYLVWRVSKELADRGVDSAQIERFKLDGVDFNDLTPKVATLHSAKGLTFDTVILSNLTTHWYKGGVLKGRPVAQRLFVGCSRARECVYLTTARGGEIPELARLEPLIAQGKLVCKLPHSEVPVYEEADDEDFLPL